MREVFVHQDSARVGYYQSVLQEAGIQSFVRNEIGSHIVEMPSPLFFPSLCVVRDGDYEEAIRILGEIHTPQPAVGADWICQKCGETVPGSFEFCWKCETPRPDAPVNETD